MERDTFNVIILIILISGIGVILGKQSDKNRDSIIQEIHKQDSIPTSVRNAGDYQLYIDNDSIYLYDDNRKVGVFPWDSSKLSFAIMDDNR